MSWCKEGEYNAQISPKSELCGFKWANTHNKCVNIVDALGRDCVTCVVWHGLKVTLQTVSTDLLCERRLGPFTALDKPFFHCCDLRVLHVVLTWAQPTPHTLDGSHVTIRGDLHRTKCVEQILDDSLANKCSGAFARNFSGSPSQATAQLDMPFDYTNTHSPPHNRVAVAGAAHPCQHPLVGHGPIVAPVIIWP